ncbi:unnamed protein product, partial [Coregonus sp. 'balchen']
MSKIELLGLIFNQGFRAAPELFRAVEKTITKYQGKYSLSKEENAVNPGCSAAQGENSESVDRKESGRPLSALKTHKLKRTRTGKGQSPAGPCCK